MNRKGQGAIIGMSIGAILLVVILAVIFSLLTAQTTTTSVPEDVFTAANGTCVRVTVETSDINCISPGSTSSILNGTNAEESLDNFTECGVNGDLFGYDMVAGSEISLVAASMNATYTARSCAFITSGTTRTLVNLLPVLLGIAVLIFILGFIALKGRG